MDGENTEKIKERPRDISPAFRASSPASSLFILESTGVRPAVDHRQLASWSQQGHPLRDRLNTGRLLYEILPGDREGGSEHWTDNL